MKCTYLSMFLFLLQKPDHLQKNMKLLSLLKEVLGGLVSLASNHTVTSVASTPTSGNAEDLSFYDPGC